MFYFLPALSPLVISLLEFTFTLGLPERTSPSAEPGVTESTAYINVQNAPQTEQGTFTEMNHTQTSSSPPFQLMSFFSFTPKPWCHLECSFLYTLHAISQQIFYFNYSEHESGLFSPIPLSLTILNRF